MDERELFVLADRTLAGVVSRARAQQWRGFGVFPAPVPVPDDAPLQDRLLGLVGRNPGA